MRDKLNKLWTKRPSVLGSLLDHPVAVVSGDEAVVHRMMYLFSAILRTEFSHFDDLSDVLRQETPLSSGAVLLCFNDMDSTAEYDDLRAIKSLPNAPLVMVMQSDTSAGAAEAFLHGADDVAKWPCSLVELVIRINVRLGHQTGEMDIDLAETDWEVESYISQTADLTMVEGQVMRILFARRGETVTREDLSQALDNRSWQYGDRKFDVHIAKIRKKLSNAFGSKISVSTVRSAGYQLTTEGPQTSLF